MTRSCCSRPRPHSGRSCRSRWQPARTRERVPGLQTRPAPLGAPGRARGPAACTRRWRPPQSRLAPGGTRRTSSQAPGGARRTSSPQRTACSPGQGTRPAVARGGAAGRPSRRHRSPLRPRTGGGAASPRREACPRHRTGSALASAGPPPHTGGAGGAGCSPQASSVLALAWAAPPACPSPRGASPAPPRSHLGTLPAQAWASGHGARAAEAPRRRSRRQAP
mmetsp:Transcript_11112/g.35263  ORF Transcript_11112/g.35263 Transcript_11112/m.35263 type:complete len:222 (-) Transcript_11112:190-855(-)